MQLVSSRMESFTRTSIKKSHKVLSVQFALATEANNRLVRIFDGALYDEISFHVYFSTHVCALPGILNSVVIILNERVSYFMQKLNVLYEL